MSKVIIASSPNLSFLVIGKKTVFEEFVPLPLIITSKCSLNWEACNFLTSYAGGVKVYNIKPLASTVVKKAYSLNIFCNFIESSGVPLHLINDGLMYQFVEELKKGVVNESTITSNVRTALEFIVFLSTSFPQWELATDGSDLNLNYKVHYSIKNFRKGRFTKNYLSHRCLDGVTRINTEAEYVRDEEYLKWLDAINCTSLHPKLDEFIISRWQSFSTLLEITGSRISEVTLITRTMIKNAAKNILEPNQTHTIKGIKIAKGKFKGKTRDVTVTKEDLQIILIYIDLIEEKFPSISHDGLFVDCRTGVQLKPSYLKNYARKVINKSKYANDLRHIVNHSFRHRFITLNIAKEIRILSNQGSFKNILSVAADACRKLTMHASNETLSHYVHLASELIQSASSNNIIYEKISSHLLCRIKKITTISEKIQTGLLSNTDGLNQILDEVSALKKIIF